MASTTEATGWQRPIVWYEALMRFLAGMSMIMIVIIITAQVLARYIFGTSLIWAEELCRYILIWQTFLLIGMAYSRGELVAVDIVPNLLTPRLRLALKAVMAVPILVFLWLIMVSGYDYSTRFGRQIIPAIDFISVSLIGRPVGVSIFWVYVSVAIGSALLGLHIIGSVIADFRALVKGNHEATPHPTIPQA